MNQIACLLLTFVAIAGQVHAESPIIQIPAGLASLHSMQSCSPTESEQDASLSFVTKANHLAVEQLNASSTSGRLYYCSKTGALVEHVRFKEAFRFLIIPNSLQFDLKPTTSDKLHGIVGIDIKMVYEMHRQREAVSFSGGPSFAILAEANQSDAAKQIADKQKGAEP